MNGTMKTAALMAGLAGTILPALAAPGPIPPQVAIAATANAASPPRDAASQAKAAKPLVMLVCREVRGPGRPGAVRAAALACVTQWAGL